MNKNSTKHKAALLLLLFSIIIAGSSSQQTGGTLTTVTNFDDYLELINTTLTYKGRLRIVEAVWGQIRAERANDLNAIATLYQQLPNFPNAVSVGVQLQQQQAAYELKQTLRAHLVRGNAELLAGALTGPQFYASPQVAKYCDELFSRYDYALVKTAYENAIDQVYNFMTPELLASRLLSIYQAKNPKSYQLSLELQLYLFWHFTNSHHVNDIYVFNFAYYIYKLMQNGNYQNLNATLKQETQNTIAQLPVSVQSLLFLNTLTFRNQYYNEPFYTTNTMLLDDDTRATFTWTSRKIIDNSFKWNRIITETLDTTNPNFQAQKHLSFQFVSWQFNIYLYYTPVCKNLRDVIGAWAAVGVPPPRNGNWNVLLNQGNLIIKQGEYAMCADKTLYNADRRYVFGVKTSSNQVVFPKNCQWTANQFALA